VLHVKEEVVRVCRRFLELGLTHGEASSVVVSSMDQKCPDARIFGNPHGAPDRIYEKPSAQASTVLLPGYSQAREQKTAHLTGHSALLDRFGGLGPFNASGRQRVIADDEFAASRHEDSGVPGDMVGPAVLPEPQVQLLRSAVEVIEAVMPLQRGGRSQ